MLVCKSTMSKNTLYRKLIGIIIVLTSLHNADAEIKVTYNGTTIPPNFDFIIVRDQVRTITCEDTSSKEAVTWKKDDVQISETSTDDIFQEIINFTSMLTFLISNSYEDEEGAYICESSVISSVMSSATLNIILHVPVHDVQIKKDSDLITTQSLVLSRSQVNTLECLAQGNPLPTIQWTTPPDVTGVTSSGGTLTFGTDSNFQKDLSYICTATNSVSDSALSVTFVITIEGPPILVDSSPANPPLKDSLMLSCEIKSNPEATITWHHNIPKPFFDIMSTSSPADFSTTSEFAITSALCFESMEISCSANDAFLKTFTINEEPYSSIEDKYYIYKGSSSALFDGALNTCQNDHDGSMMCLKAVTKEFKAVFANETLEWTSFYVMNCSDLNACVIVNPTDWSTSECGSTDTVNYICEVTAMHYPQNLEASVDQCSNILSLNWTQDDVLSTLTQLVSIKGLNGSTSIVSMDAPIYTVQVDPREELNIQVHSTNICTKAPYAKAKVISGYGPLQLVQQTSTENEDTCSISWDRPEFYWEIKEYVLTVTRKGENLAETSLIVNKLSYDFKMDPASEYSITLTARSMCDGKDSPASTVTKCILGNRAPSSLPMITEPTNVDKDNSGRVLIDAENGIPVNFSVPDQTNGAISCICVIVIQQSITSSVSTGSINITNEKPIILSGSEIDNVADGDKYLAYTTSESSDNVVINIGVGELTSTCDPVVNSRRKRALGTTYNAKNIALSKNKSYQYYIFTTTADGSTLFYASTSWSSVYKTNAATKSNGGLIGGVVVAALILVFLIVLLLFLFWRRKRKEKCAENSSPVTHTNQQTLPTSAKNGTHVNPAFSVDEDVDDLPLNIPPIPLNKMKDIYLQKHADEDRIFRTEYANLASQVQKLEISYDYSEKLEVRHKNRFSNIHSANESLVRLRRGGTDDHSDYINASYIHGYRHPNKFIATQGPIPHTIADFWYMVYEQESTVVVMLTRLVEYGRKKCEQYWPENNETCSYGNMLVTHLSTVVYGDVIKRTFECSNPNQSQKKHKVEQFHFIAWPDHGVPNTTSSIFNLRRMVSESSGQGDSPIVVHCSAGVGRSGAFIILDTILCQIKMESRLDIFSMVVNLRRRRKEMVQTVEQYSLLHKLAWEAHAFCDIKDRTVEEFQAKFGSNAEYQELNLIEIEFDNLSVVPPIKTAIVEAEPNNLRDSNIFPYQHSKVVVRMRPYETTPPFYNASHIKSYDPSNEFIACQGAFPHQVEQFWRVVLDNEIKCIVMLTETEEDGEDKCSQYWPNDVDAISTYGSVDVTLIEENRTDNITERSLQVKEKVAYMNREGEVKQYHLHGWSETSLPEQISDILTLVGLTQQQRTKSVQPVPVLVHCSDGSGRTGTFCAISTLLERIKNENRIDVFRIVKDLRDLRPLMVKTVEEYRYCYKVVESYLNTFQTYSNFK